MNEQELSESAIKKLKLFIDSYYEGKYCQFATALNIPNSYVYNWLKYKKPFSPTLVLKIEEATKGLVRRYEMRPDLYEIKLFEDIWPIIANLKGYIS